MRRVPRGELGIPAIVVYELEYGSLKASFAARRRALLHNAIMHTVQVPFDTDAARTAARIRVDLEARGCVIGPLDLLIAGTALSRNAALATNNAAEFSRIGSLSVISVR